MTLREAKELLKKTGYILKETKNLTESFETKITWYSPKEKLPTMKDFEGKEDIIEDIDEYIDEDLGSIEVMIVYSDGTVGYGTFYEDDGKWFDEHRNLNANQVKLWAYKPFIGLKG
jgi:hypothetical protein